MRLYPAMTQIRWMVLAALAACATESVETPDTPDIIESKKPCEDIICGNAAQLGAHRWWELDATGSSFSPKGKVKIVGFHTAASVPLGLQIDGFRLLGVLPNNGGTIGGPALVGSQLLIDSDQNEHYIMTLDGVGYLPYVEGGLDATMIPIYNWSYIQVGSVNTTPVPVCDGALIDPLDPDTVPSPLLKDSIIFTGDRYDGATATVQTIGNTQPWFNFACRDDVLWKQFLFRYVSVAQGLNFHYDVAARNTSIAAIHADYCGNNHPYTETGTDVDWGNRTGKLWLDKGYKKLEAIWRNGRAVCLRYPRKVPKSSVDCGGGSQPPDCSTALIANWATLGYEMITYVP